MQIKLHSEGQRLALLYEQRHGLTQQEAAARLGITGASWSRYRSAERKPLGRIAIQVEDRSAGEIPARSWWEPAKSGGARTDCQVETTKGHTER